MAEKTQAPVILLTGVTSGIGLALALKLVKINTYRLILSGRNPHQILNKFGIKESESVIFKELDVSSSEQCERIIEEIEKSWGGVDILVNNAGISYRSVIEHMSREDMIHQLQVNFLGPMELIRLVLPEMRRKRNGRILNVSSVGGMMAMPTMGGYSASKFALEGASEALWYEVRAWNIKVSLIQPGFINSNSFKRVYWSPDAKHSVEVGSGCSYSGYYSYMSRFIERLMKLSFATPESIAEKIIKTIQKENPKLRVPVTIDAVVFTIIRRFLPRALYHYILFFFLPGVRNACK